LRTCWPHSRWRRVTPSCLAVLLASGLATVCLCQPSQLEPPFTMWRCTQAREASWRALLAPVLALSAKVCFFALATFSSFPVQTVSHGLHDLPLNQSGKQQQAIMYTSSSVIPLPVRTGQPQHCSSWVLSPSTCSYCLIAIAIHTQQPADSPTIVA